MIPKNRFFPIILFIKQNTVVFHGRNGDATVKDPYLGFGTISVVPFHY